MNRSRRLIALETGIEIRWHGRGGQGAVTSAELLALAAISEGQYAQAFPSFGPERRGAPVLSFVRISRNAPLRIRAEITEPDVVVVLDPGLLPIANVTAGLKPDGIVVTNTKKGPDDIRREFGIKHTLATVDATRIAREILGVPITNTTMIGALLNATGVVKIESLEEPLMHRFGQLGARNFQAMKRAYEETVVKERA
ncbi:MAG: 2-oxoacid:acceptor oxidoreductase family protein [Dehalococcoidales bacterium]|nr:2-oxoacid:acceptor oxidoreductase family protein [Dehalococcoidales bacterium]